MADFELSALAADDLAQITDNSEERFGERQTKNYTSLIKRTIGTVSNFSFAGTLYTTTKGKTFRRIPAGSHVVFYLPGRKPLFVVRILHMAMDFDRHLDD